MRKFRVVVTDPAIKDIEDIYDYIAKNDSIKNAEYVLDKLEETIYKL